MLPRRRLLAAFALALAVSACSGGSDRSDVIREGRELFTGKGCSTCHGGRGQGGVGPALSGVAATFAACGDQVEWVRLGSDGWLRERGDRYGDTAKAVKGGMPEFGLTLTDREVRTVIAYERTEFGGLDELAVRTDCGV